MLLTLIHTTLKHGNCVGLHGEYVYSQVKQTRCACGGPDKVEKKTKWERGVIKPHILLVRHI